MVILSAGDWVCIFVLFVVYMKCPTHIDATGGWVMQGFVFKWFSLVSSHYLILSRVAAMKLKDVYSLEGKL